MTERAEPSDDDLLPLLRSGDEAAFSALYRRWQGRLYRFALRMTGSEALAEDALQETFLVVIGGAAGYDPARGSFPGWLFGVARNQVLTRLRRESRFVPLEPDAGEPVHEVRAVDDIQAELLRREDVERVRGAVLDLAEPFREAVVLCDLQGLSYEDAAQAMGCPIGTVRSRLHRARGMLAERLREPAPPAAAAPLRLARSTP
jgi:RNA polymerase sigma-70 factor (ECF subfamily)